MENMQSNPVGRDVPHNEKHYASAAILLVVFALLAQSCMVSKTIYTARIFDSWIGKSSRDLMLQQGTPSQMVSDGHGGQIYVYDHSYFSVTTYSHTSYVYDVFPDVIAVQPGATVSNQSVVPKKVEYFINKDGVIYSWHSTGYPETFEQKYPKKDLRSGSIDTIIFVPLANAPSHR